MTATGPGRLAARLRSGQVSPEDERYLSELFASVSNRGRWGADDERGTLNHVTPGKTRRAAALVERGIVVSASHDIDTSPSRKNRRPAILRMDEIGAADIAATDELTLAVHSVTVTHVDAVTHVFFGDHLYNGRRVEDEVRADGLHFASVLAQAPGVVTRAVILDVARARGVPYLEPSESVGVEDLDAAERLAHIKVEPGDAVLVRIGLGARERARGDEDPAERAGLTVECLRWLHARRVSVYGGDCFDKLPSAYPGLTHPVHAIGLAAMGLVMIDNVAMEAVTEVARREARSACMFVMAPLRVPKGTGSAVNPLCVF